MNEIEILSNEIFEQSESFVNTALFNKINEIIDYLKEDEKFLIKEKSCDNCILKNKKSMGNPDGCSIYFELKKYGGKYCDKHTKE